MGMVTGSGNSAIHQFFSYDSSGNVVSVDYSSNGGGTFTTYYYLRNAQNDIVKIIDGNGATVVEYKNINMTVGVRYSLLQAAWRLL